MKFQNVRPIRYITSVIEPNMRILKQFNIDFKVNAAVIII